MQTDESLTPKQTYDRDRYVRLKAERDALKPADPIDGLTVEQVAYIAGLLDGDGSIYIAAVGPERSRTVYPIVVFAMTHYGVIAHLAEILAAGTVKRHNPTALRRNPTYKPQFRTQLFGRRAQMLCTRMLPYLHVKRAQAELVTTFPVEARVGPGVKIAQSDINEVRYRLRDQVNALNH